MIERGDVGKGKASTAKPQRVDKRKSRAGMEQINMRVKNREELRLRFGVQAIIKKKVIRASHAGIKGGDHQIYCLEEGGQSSPLKRNGERKSVKKKDCGGERKGVSEGKS